MNLAFRLQSATRKYLAPTIVGEASAKGYPDMVFRELYTVAVKGTAMETRIYEPICLKSELGEAKQAMQEAHQQALQAWYSRDRTLARVLFSQLAVRYPDDLYCFRMMEKATERRGLRNDNVNYIMS